MFRSLLIILIIILIMGYFNVSVGGVINFFVSLVNYLASIMQSLLNTLIRASQSIGVPSSVPVQSPTQSQA